MAIMKPIPIKNPYQFITLKIKSIAIKIPTIPAKEERAIIVFLVLNSIPIIENDFFIEDRLYC